MTSSSGTTLRRFARGRLSRFRWASSSSPASLLAVEDRGRGALVGELGRLAGVGANVVDRAGEDAARSSTAWRRPSPRPAREIFAAKVSPARGRRSEVVGPVQLQAEQPLRHRRRHHQVVRVVVPEQPPKAVGVRPRPAQHLDRGPDHLLDDDVLPLRAQCRSAPAPLRTGWAATTAAPSREYCRPGGPSPAVGEGSVRIGQLARGPPWRSTWERRPASADDVAPVDELAPAGPRARRPAGWGARRACASPSGPRGAGP